MIRAALWSSGATLSRALLGLTMNKIAAVTGGPAAVVALGNFLNLFTMGGSLATGGTASGVVKYVSEYNDSPAKQEALVSTAAAMAATSSALLAACLVAGRAPIAATLLYSADHAWVIGLLGVCLVFLAGQQLALATLNGLGKFRHYAMLSIAADLLAISLAILLSPWLSWRAAMTGAILGPAIVFVLFLARPLAKASAASFWSRIRFDRGESVHLGGFALMVATSLIAAPVTQLLIRNHLVAELGARQAGIWQGLWYFSDSYVALLTSTLSVVLLPRFSALPMGKPLVAELRATYRLLIPSVLVLSAAIFLTRDLIIAVLFSHEFSAMRDLFQVQLIGGIIRVAAWVLGFLLIARAMIGTMIFCELFFSASLVALSILMVSRYGLEGMPIAYSVNYALYLLFLVVYFYRKLFAVGPGAQVEGTGIVVK
jgi:PST family polysaccharide transporter